MIKMNRNIEYALMALQFIKGQGQGRPVSVKEICEKLSSPFDSTSRVLQKMSRSQWLSSTQGANGGYLLNENLFAGVSLHDLIELISGGLKLVKCIDGDCEFTSSCNIQTPVNRLNNGLVGYYKTVFVKDLLSDTKIKLKPTLSVQVRL